MSMALESELNQSVYSERNDLYIIEEQTDNFTSFRGEFEVRFEDILQGRSKAKGFYNLL
jgi:hypothetical protein